MPDFFKTAFEVPVREVASPGFQFENGKGVSAVRTVLQTILGVPQYLRSVNVFKEVVTETKPDLIINFLEPVAGIFNLLHSHSTPVIAVGHQFMMQHPGFRVKRSFGLQHSIMSSYIDVVSARSTRVALSFYDAGDVPGNRVYVCPPLLRKELFTLPPKSGAFLLVYLINHGYSEEIIQWHKANPSVPLHCFYDKPMAEPEFRYSDTLTFHRLNGEKFLKMMADCHAVVCTAGFESVSEAAYLQKPVLMVPLQNHVEQQMNALDAEAAGLGLADTEFNLSRLLVHERSSNDGFKRWVDQAESIFMRVVSEVASRHIAEVTANARHTAGSYVQRRIKEISGI